MKMPTPLIKQFAKESGKSEKDVEALWEKAKTLAKAKFKKKDSSFYAYTTGILKNMLALASDDGDANLGGYYSESLSKPGKVSKVKLKGAIKGRSTKKKLAKDKKGHVGWTKLTLKQQQEYLKKHPKSKRKITHRGPKKIKKAATFESDEAKPVLQEVTPEAVEKEEATPVAEAPESKEPTAEEVAQTEEKENQEPNDLTNLTPKKRRLILNVVKAGFGKLTHVVKEKKETVTKGVKAFDKISTGEKLTSEDKEHLKDLATILMGVTLVAAVAFLPVAQYSGALTQMYLDHLHSRRERKTETDSDQDPMVVNDEPTLDGLEDHEQLILQNESLNMAEWLMDQDQNKLINKLQSDKG
jgi:hypothetical protein